MEQRVYRLSYCLSNSHAAVFTLNVQFVRLAAGRPTQAGDATDQWRHRWNAANSLPHWVMIACFSCQLIDCSESSTLIDHLLKGTQTAQSTGFQSGLFGDHMWCSTNVTFSRRRYVGVFMAVCDGAPSCCRHPCKMTALLLQDVTVTLDNNCDNKHVVPC